MSKKHKLPWYLRNGKNVEIFNITKSKVLTTMARNTAAVYVYFGYARWDEGRLVFIKSSIQYKLLYHRRVRTIVQNREGGKCFWCGIEDGSTIDHVLPRSRGGPTIPENCVWSCPRCNVARGNKIPSNLESIWGQLITKTARVRHQYFPRSASSGTQSVPVVENPLRGCPGDDP